jgi:hypothetical protein
LDVWVYIVRREISRNCHVENPSKFIFFTPYVTMKKKKKGNVVEEK